MDAKNLEATNGIFSVKSDINKEEIISVKKGAWSSLEDSLLMNYIAIHGEGRWNFVARGSGLKRTGKSCRLRWKNYLRPNVRRGNFTLEEQLRIMELHCLYGNRWSKIAKFLPDRTDNEIKNYWRSRVVKQAKQLKYDTNSVELREFVRDICLPRLSEKIHASQCSNNNNNNNNNNNEIMNCDVIENIGPEALQMDNWASWSNNISSNVMEAHQITVSNNLSTCSGCEFFNSTTLEMDFGQQYYGFDNPYNGCGFQGSDNPAWFSYGELSNRLLNND